MTDHARGVARNRPDAPTGGCRRRPKDPLGLARMHRRSDDLIEDAMIAATAIVHNLTVVTRNVRAFDRLGVRTLNPFSTRTA